MATSPAPPRIGLSVVVPTYNEELRLPPTLERLAVWADDLPQIDLQVVISDDGSGDRTVEIAHAWVGARDDAIVVHHDRNRGKGAALRQGFAAADHDLVAFLDADLPIGPESLLAMVELSNSADVVAGTRRGRGASMPVPQPILRRAGGRAFLAVIGAMGLGVTSDPQCGVKVLRRGSVAATLDACRSDRFAFDIELIERSRQAGLVVVECPLEWHHVAGSTLRPFRDGVVTLLDLVRVRRILRTGDGRTGA